MWVYYLGQKYANIGGKITPNFLQCKLVPIIILLPANNMKAICSNSSYLSIVIPRAPISSMFFHILTSIFIYWNIVIIVVALVLHVTRFIGVCIILL